MKDMDMATGSIESPPKEMDKTEQSALAPAMQLLTDFYNYYSTGDEVLQIRDTPPAMLSDLHYVPPFTIDMGQYAWHKQELGKGRLSIGDPLVAGTTWAGWERQRFQVWRESPSGNTGWYEYVPLSPAVANAMTDAELRVTPVFRHNPEALFSSTIAFNTVAEILACGIPALSGPAGSRKLPEDMFSGENVNVNSWVNECWPRKTGSYPSRWLHSDLKNMALPFVRQLFERIVVE